MSKEWGIIPVMWSVIVDEILRKLTNIGIQVQVYADHTVLFYTLFDTI